MNLSRVGVFVLTLFVSWQPITAADGLPSSPLEDAGRPYLPETAVTLIEYLPPVGRQGPTDCVAWSLGYASVTCQIAQERRRSPTSTYDQFSPAFLYNHVEKQDDQTIDPGDTIAFLESSGCASVATCPFDCKHTSSKADREANLYHAEDSEELKNLGQVRKNIDDGYPVCLVVYADAEFQKRDCDPRTYLYRCRVIGNRQSRHAITAVGYDNQRKALLIMNSYGTGWKDKGFCWVAYDQLHGQFGTGGWCDQAHVIRVKTDMENIYLDTVSTLRIDGDFAYPGETRSNRHYQLMEHGVYIRNADGQKATRITPADWTISDVATNGSFLFAYMNRKQDGIAVPSQGGELIRLHGEKEWAFSSKSWSVPHISMMASAPNTNLFFISQESETPKLFEFDPRKNIPSPVTLPNDAFPIDLRTGEIGRRRRRRDAVIVTTSDQQIYYREGDSWNPY